ncbi:MAG: SpoIIE family protein phosphatase [Candidatus Eiseniibacteriota bacterium]|nr:MAG: SpoIIE family protein phosphatase [Candidatus Eisenbacteria bacterium]
MAGREISDERLRAIEEENQRLRRAVDELTILNDLARGIGASLNSQDIMDTIIRRSLRAVRAEQGVITLVDKQAKQPMKTLIRSMVSSSELQPFHLDQSLLGWMHLNKKPLVISDPQNDERFRGVKWDEPISSVLCVPLLVRTELIGVLTLYNKRGGGGFTEEDHRLLAIIAAQSAQVVENARLYEEEQALLRMQEEVRFASEIQLGLLPKEAPRIAGYDIAGISIPAQVVGGDYFDFIPMEDHCIVVCLGDISGKGLPAALLMANLQATIRGQSFLGPSPRECIARSNKLLFRSTDPGKFATLFYGILDFEKHELFYCNAGHDRPFLFAKENRPTRLDVGGIVLSCMEEFSYEEAVVPFGPGDSLVVFSDGITEARNEVGEEYGEERLSALLKGSLDEPAPAMIDRVIESVREHAGDCPQTDDMTLVVIKRDRA